MSFCRTQPREQEPLNVGSGAVWPHLHEPSPLKPGWKKKSPRRGTAPGQTLSHWEGQERVRRKTDIERPPGEGAVPESPSTLPGHLTWGVGRQDGGRAQGKGPALQSPECCLSKGFLTPGWWSYWALTTGKV